MTIHYTDDDINNIILNGFEFSFDKYVLEKIQKLSRDDKLRRKIAYNGKTKYTKYFNSTLVAQFIINKTLGIHDKIKYMWLK